MVVEKKGIVLAIAAAILLNVAIYGVGYVLFPPNQSFSSQPLSGKLYAAILGSTLIASFAIAVGIMLLKKRKREPLYSAIRFCPEFSYLPDESPQRRGFAATR